MFEVGQKVVCIDDDWRPYPPTYFGQFSLPVKGATYLIDGVRDYPDGQFLVLVGFGSQPDFRATRFRPIVEKKTDISIFTALLSNVPKHEREVV